MIHANAESAPGGRGFTRGGFCLRLRQRDRHKPRFPGRLRRYWRAGTLRMLRWLNTGAGGLKVDTLMGPKLDTLGPFLL